MLKLQDATLLPSHRAIMLATQSNVPVRGTLKEIIMFEDDVTEEAKMEMLATAWPSKVYQDSKSFNKRRISQLSKTRVMRKEFFYNPNPMQFNDRIAPALVGRDIDPGIL